MSDLLSTLAANIERTVNSIVRECAEWTEQHEFINWHKRQGWRRNGEVACPVNHALWFGDGRDSQPCPTCKAQV